jgi:general L-amino acid transport system permease protein
MSGMPADPRLQAARAAPRKGLRLSWSDSRLRNIVWQVVIVGAVAALFWYLAANTMSNLQARRIATGFGFLDRTAGIPIGESIVAYDPAVNTYGWALMVGVLNTLKVAVVGVVLATFLGTVIGIGRLSKNWLISRICAVYVETLRDIPLLLQLLLWYTLLQSLPQTAQALTLLDSVFLSIKGLRFPIMIWEPAHWWVLGAFLVGMIGVVAANRSALRKRDETGIKPAIWPFALGLLVVMPNVVWLALGFPHEIDFAHRGGFRGRDIVGGGLVSPEYFALLFGLVVYTAAYIAEIVRSGIQSVPVGQWEAATALGLQPGPIMRQIVLPQALRVIIPPMTSQYLNITKNSSLAVAIGFPDLVSVAQTTLNQTGQAVEGIAVIMGVFLTISLSISLFMNWYNAQIALVER